MTPNTVTLFFCAICSTFYSKPLFSSSQINSLLKSSHSVAWRDGAVWGSSTEVGAGPEYPPSAQLVLQQPQPRSAGGRMCRASYGNQSNRDYQHKRHESLPHGWMTFQLADRLELHCLAGISPAVLCCTFLINYNERYCSWSWTKALLVKHTNPWCLPVSCFPLSLQGESHNNVFAEKLETLLHRAYHLQEDFGSSIPTDSVLADFGKRHVGFAYKL